VGISQDIKVSGIKETIGQIVTIVLGSFCAKRLVAAKAELLLGSFP
jgi:hypothetical protein